MTWQEVVEHPSLQDLPFKIELNGDGNIIMSPTYNSHGGRQVQIALLLTQQLPNGKAGVEIGVQTSDNVKVPDVVWFTAEHWRIAESEFACSTAPAICVEVASEGNTLRELNAKKALYFEAGAQEVWICDKFGNMSFFTPAGQAAVSPMCPHFPATVQDDAGSVVRDGSESHPYLDATGAAAWPFRQVPLRIGTIGAAGSSAISGPGAAK